MQHVNWYVDISPVIEGLMTIPDPGRVAKADAAALEGVRKKSSK